MSANRHAGQVRFAPYGTEGQERLASLSVLVVGVGALGSASSELLVRAGVGRLILVDRDVVEESNLARQALYTEADARSRRPKVEAAAAALGAIDGRVHVDIHADELHTANGPALVSDAGLVLDGTDNFETRYLINDLCLDAHKPWIYAGANGASGLVAGFLPGQGCLRCLFPEPPAAGETATCETTGVLASATRWAAGLQVAMTMRFAREGRFPQGPFRGDLWDGEFATLAGDFRRDDCPACGQGERPFAAGMSATDTVRLCGRNTVQVRPGVAATLDPLTRDVPGEVISRTRFAVGFVTPDGALRVHLFRDGRALVEGTDDPATALAAYRRWVGL